MNTKRKNRSVIRTQALLKKGLIELMRKAPAQKITFKQLTYGLCKSEQRHLLSALPEYPESSGTYRKRSDDEFIAK